MEEKVLIELTAAEAVMLQELAGQAGDRAVEAWKRKPLEGLARKAAEAYQNQGWGLQIMHRKSGRKKNTGKRKVLPGTSCRN